MLSSEKPVIKDIHYNELTSEICESWYSLSLIHIYIPLQDAAQASSYYLEDGSFVKLDNITLGYNVPVKKLGFMQNLRLYY